MQLSLPELSYTRQSLTAFEPPIRNDGRSIDQLRALSGQVNILPGAHGSARIKWGSSVEVLVGIKADVSDATIHGGAFEASVEVSPAVTTQNRETDHLPSSLTSALQDVLDALPVGYLKFTPSKAWKIHVDAIVMLCTIPNENILSALSLATSLALQTTRIPKISTPNVTEMVLGSSKFEPSEEYDVDSEWDNAVPLQGLENISVIITVSSVDQIILIDPTVDEANVAQATYAVGVLPDGSTSYTRSISMGGGYASTGRAITTERYISLVQVASIAGTKLLDASKSLLAYEGSGFFDILP
ncbi:exosome subunit Rrp42 [Schizosaccharomyces octosporus yFS286]|uniref:Ribosomal RNA-processing protein 42 n=1 Tax=Schizosaccharomyces octosporus (strain yFS286) TaxID=483514 RepID=S9R4F9_SCHOY|nr:exosome subunit Rrp42 [Schizosaccharomyces octosporus yFS286]EPX73235.1 exosome subunit Rrp42 [Schizosaccharomyces octosporus yFS286]